ncbi:MAG: hypothetical protein AB8C84_05120 [Oligoflexales bacterium]
MNLRFYIKYMMIRMFSAQFILFMIAMFSLKYQLELIDGLAHIPAEDIQNYILIFEKRSWSLQWLIGFIFTTSILLQMRNWKKSLQTYILPLEEVENVIQEYRAGNKLRRYNIHRKNDDFITLGRMLNRILDEK